MRTSCVAPKVRPLPLSPANLTTMAREYDLNEPVSPLVLLDDAQRRAHQQIASPLSYRPRARGMRFWLLRCALAIALATLGWVAWSAAIAPVRVSASDVETLCLHA